LRDRDASKWITAERFESVSLGRKPKLTPHQKEEARRRIAKGE
jgi:hypothetical protein